uniref:Uncharacterized protein n=1 Tax=Chromera velia CCMP2878 TaxID=1169474 RepID=A0A0G4HG39_9ALVE|eukprot:Cvel_6678.t1-p1 / transcript=Cvel_6678.t1 / gene=Cvel_6678 / organism=Chromera_velia_CCMP2878 / gene_product=hypothetical protein / transcript_product=hypothetical protein / location=Cvel_scaffold332:23750-43422(-) / protein_length=1037 / sequence_SO=supercontig / SO=protein_coding / is_pseudo=false
MYSSSNSRGVPAARSTGSAAGRTSSRGVESQRGRERLKCPQWQSPPRSSSHTSIRWHGHHHSGPRTFSSSPSPSHKARPLHSSSTASRKGKGGLGGLFNLPKGFTLGRSNAHKISKNTTKQKRKGAVRKCWKKFWAFKHTKDLLKAERSLEAQAHSASIEHEEVESGSSSSSFPVTAVLLFLRIPPSRVLHSKETSRVFNIVAFIRDISQSLAEAVPRSSSSPPLSVSDILLDVDIGAQVVGESYVRVGVSPGVLSGVKVHVRTHLKDHHGHQVRRATQLLEGLLNGLNGPLQSSPLVKWFDLHLRGNWGTAVLTSQRQPKLLEGFWPRLKWATCAGGSGASRPPAREMRQNGTEEECAQMEIPRPQKLGKQKRERQVDNGCEEERECTSPCGTFHLGVGSHHSCALLDDGQVRCWGLNDKGQLGADDRLSRGLELRTPRGNDSTVFPRVHLGRGPVTFSARQDFLSSVALGSEHGCALVDSSWPSTPGEDSIFSSQIEVRTGPFTVNSLYCWGRNDDQRLHRAFEQGNKAAGVGPLTPKSEIPGRGSERVSPLYGVAAFGAVTCAAWWGEVRAPRVSCFGPRNHVLTGPEGGKVWLEGQTEDGETIVSLSVGFSHACAVVRPRYYGGDNMMASGVDIPMFRVLKSQFVICFGNDEKGQLPNGMTQRPSGECLDLVTDVWASYAQFASGLDSYRIAPGCAASVYTKPNFSGDSEEGITSSGGIAMGRLKGHVANRVGSIRCSCQGASLFRDASGRGCCARTFVGMQGKYDLVQVPFQGKSIEVGYAPEEPQMCFEPSTAIDDCGNEGLSERHGILPSALKKMKHNAWAFSVADSCRLQLFQHSGYSGKFTGWLRLPTVPLGDILFTQVNSFQCGCDWEEFAPPVWQSVGLGDGFGCAIVYRPNTWLDFQRFPLEPIVKSKDTWVAYDRGGLVHCWGDNGVGQLGLGLWNRLDSRPEVQYVAGNEEKIAEFIRTWNLMNPMNPNGEYWAKRLFKEEGGSARYIWHSDRPVELDDFFSTMHIHQSQLTTLPMYVSGLHG